MIKNTFKVKTIGEVLKEKRVSKNLSLKQVSEITKIRSEYLEALESGSYKVFPSEVYIKGFLKNYSKFLGIEEERSLALYRRENTKAGQKQDIKESGLEKREKTGFTITPERIILFVISIISIAIIYYLASQIGVIIKTPELEIDSPIEIGIDETKEYETDEDTISIKGKISAGASLKINGDDVSTNNLEQFEIKELSLNNGQNEFIFTAESEFGRESRLILLVNKLASSNDDPENETGQLEVPPAITVMKATIQINTGPANVLVITDGQTQVNRVYNPGESVEFSATSSVIIQTPRPTYLSVTINDTPYTLSTSERYEWNLVDGVVVQK